MSDQNDGQASALDKYLQKQKDEGAQASQTASVTPITPMPRAQAPASPGLNLNISSTPTQAIEAAGFWRRAMATMIDGILMNIVTQPLSFAISFTAAFLEPKVGPLISLLGVIISSLSTIAVMGVYYVWFYTKKGATPGKLVMGMRVLDSEKGTNLTWGQVLLRELVGKFCSAVTLGIGYLLVAFRDDKKALHDIMFNSRVIRVRAK